MATWKKICIVLSWLIMIFLKFRFVDSAHIVFYHNIASYSHRVPTYILADALEKRGHQVTYISPFHPRGPYINPNITEIVPNELAVTMQTMLDVDLDINNRVYKRFDRMVFSFYSIAEVGCRQLLESEELLAWTSKTKTVDLFIMDNCMTECGVVLAHKYGAKHIFFEVATPIASEHDVYGLLPESSAIPEMEIDPPRTPMTFLERVFNTLISIHFRYVQYTYVKKIDELGRKYLNNSSMPFLDDLVRNVSLVFHTGDIVSDYPRSHPPQMVNLGGIYCTTKNNDLPQEIKTFIESDERENDGFVYISLGSILKSSCLPPNIQQVFFDTIESFPRVKFLWKWNGPLPGRVPSNLYLSSWFPQTDLLAHPGIRAFVMQAGRPSSLEGLCNAVPLIMFPVLADQDVNANRMHKVGGSVVLEIGTVTKEQFQDALNMTVYDGRMKERVLELRNILLDRPMTALETGVWWTEYVLRHKELSHLRTASFDQYWFQRRLIDVWAFLFSIFLLSFVLLSWLVVKICKHLSQKMFERMSAKYNVSDTRKKKE